MCENYKYDQILVEHIQQLKRPNSFAEIFNTSHILIYSFITHRLWVPKGGPTLTVQKFLPCVYLSLKKTPKDYDDQIYN